MSYLARLRQQSDLVVGDSGRLCDGRPQMATDMVRPSTAQSTSDDPDVMVTVSHETTLRHMFGWLTKPLRPVARSS